MEYISKSKINLFLKVNAKREDSYHEISTIFLPLEKPFDKIIANLNANNGLKVRSSIEDLPIDGENLAGKAAILYSQKANIEMCWDFYIEKNIPIAAGMGGGSSNAATILRILNDYYQKFNEEELKNIALSLGADVPYFLSPYLAKANGVGEKLEIIKKDKLKNLHLLLVAPHFPISAKWAYSNLEPKRIGNKTEKLNIMLKSLIENNISKIAENVYNDLSFAALEKFPILKIIKEISLNNGAQAAEMSGSGPVMFVICDSESILMKIKEIFDEKFSDDNISTIVANI